MFVLANLLNAFAQILHYVLNIYMWIIIIRALLSWVNPDPYNPIVRFLYQVTEPVLDQVRKRLPYIGGIDISPHNRYIYHLVSAGVPCTDNQ